MSKKQNFFVELTVQYATHDPAYVEGAFTRIADAFVDSRGVIDGDLSANLGDCTVTFSMTIVDAKDSLDAFKRAHAAVRSALHGAGESTPGWDIDTDVDLRMRIIDTAHLARA